MKYDVFISYSRKDSAIVNEFTQQITNAGYSLWMDVDGIESGDEFKRKIASAIRDSKVFIFFSSAASNESEWTVKEVNYAITKKKHIIPIKLDAAYYNESVDFDLCAVDFIQCNGSKGIQNAVGKLLRSLKSRIGVGSTNKVIENKENEVKEQNGEHVGENEENCNSPSSNFWDFFASSTFKVSFRYLVVLLIVVSVGVGAWSSLVRGSSQLDAYIEVSSNQREQFVKDTICKEFERINEECIVAENKCEVTERLETESRYNEDIKIVCAKCNGTGVECGDVEFCKYCGGKGMQVETQFCGLDVMYVSIPCHFCLGSGKSNPCLNCGGRGFN